MQWFHASVCSGSVAAAAAAASAYDDTHNLISISHVVVGSVTRYHDIHDSEQQRLAAGIL